MLVFKTSIIFHPTCIIFHPILQYLSTDSLHNLLLSTTDFRRPPSNSVLRNNVYRTRPANSVVFNNVYLHLRSRIYCDQQCLLEERHEKCRSERHLLEDGGRKVLLPTMYMSYDKSLSMVANNAYRNHSCRRCRSQ